MPGKILAIVAIAAVCDAAVIPHSTSWPTEAGCSRSVSSGMGYLSNSGQLDYSHLFNALYPELAPDPLEGITVGLHSGLSQIGNSFEMNDLYRTISPSMRGSNRLMLPSGELCYVQCRGSGRCGNCGALRDGGECRENGRSWCDQKENFECQGCCGGRCVNDCRGYCECRNCDHRRDCECRGCDNQRNNMECRNCCDYGEGYSNSGYMGCSRSMSMGSSRAGSNCNRCCSSGPSSQRNMQCSPWRCTKMQGQFCCSPMCC